MLKGPDLIALLRHEAIPAATSTAVIAELDLVGIGVDECVLLVAAAEGLVLARDPSFAAERATVLEPQRAAQLLAMSAVIGKPLWSKPEQERLAERINAQKDLNILLLNWVAASIAYRKRQEKATPIPNPPS